MAYFAGGCFWGVEYWFSKLDGVLGAYSGYMGGYLDNPTYSDVCRGNSGHIETVKVVYDDRIISYIDLVNSSLRYTNPKRQDLELGPGGPKDY